MQRARMTAYLMLSMSLLFGTSYGMYNPIFPVFATDELGATYEDLGVIGMATFLPYTLVPLLMGISMGRVNSRYLLTAGFAVQAISVYMMSVATTIEEIILYRLMSGFAQALIWPPALHAISRDPNTRVKHIAMFTMFFVVGYMVGPLIGSLILDATQTDYRTLLLVTACVMGVGVVSILLNYPHRYTEGRHLDIRLFAEVLKYPALVAILLYSTVTFGLVLSVYPAFMHEHGLGGPVIMQLYAVFGVTRIAAFLLAKRLARNRGGAIILSTACVTVAMAISATGTTAAEFAVAMLLLGFGFAAIYPVALSMMLSGSRGVASERLVGAYEAMFGIGWILGPLSTGYVLQNSGATILFWALFAAGLGMLLLAFLFRNRMRATIRVLKYDHEFPKMRTIFIKQTFKNHFSTILVSIGMMDRELKKAGTYGDVQAGVRDMYDTMIFTVVRASETLDATDLLDAALAGRMRRLLSKIGEIDPASGVDSGYPDYDDIKKGVTYCTNRLDVSIGDDAVLK